MSSECRNNLVHPCQKCGACCASFRVLFYWREANPSDKNNCVPEPYWIENSDQFRMMKGTENKHHPKCVALQGRIGDYVSCQIYKNRSSTCQKFQASYEDGKHHEKCDLARKKHGLSPLTRQDWIQFNQNINTLKKVTDTEI